MLTHKKIIVLFALILQATPAHAIISSIAGGVAKAAADKLFGNNSNKTHTVVLATAQDVAPKVSAQLEHLIANELDVTMTEADILKITNSKDKEAVKERIALQRAHNKLLHSDIDAKADTATVLSRIQEGASKNGKVEKQTPLIRAIKTKRGETVKALLALGVNVNIQEDETGMTAVHYTAEQNNLELTKLLVEQHKARLGLKTLPKKPYFGDAVPPKTAYEIAPIGSETKEYLYTQLPTHIKEQQIRETIFIGLVVTGVIIYKLIKRQ